MTPGAPTRRELELTWSDRDERACLRVTGWAQEELGALVGTGPAELGARLAVLPSELVQSGADLEALQPVAGRFEIEGDAVCFIPRFPFLDGKSYSLLIGAQGPQPFAETSALEVWAIERPAQARAATTEVVAIYPSADEVPVNVLKLYIYFSSPMSEGWANRAVRVRRVDNDEPLQDVFLPMDPELWDPERRRLTLLLDPGRIKRGLAPHEQAGYPLIEGVPVIVSIDPAFRDAAGRPLRSEAEQRYNVGPLVRARVDPTSWRCEPPTADSRSGLTVSFGRPLDYALLQHSLMVIDAAEAAVAGEVTTGPGEWCWWFEPASPWKAGRHALIVDPRLEDLAGNSVMRVFDRDLTRVEDAPAEARPVAIDFTCGPPGPQPERSSPAEYTAS